MAGNEFPFSDKEFDEVCRVIYGRAGISLNQSKKPMVYSRLARRLRELRLATFGEYLAMLRGDPESPEWEVFTNALTTNLTAFFRESHHFDILAGLAPQWAKQHGRVSVWCAASSTGEEPYSIAMTLCESLRSLTPPVSIVASDLDTQVLAKAESGVYPLDRLDKLDIERKRQFFLKGTGDKAGFARIRPELRQAVSFKQINLLDEKVPLKGPFDAIFCRNVMIYFDKPTQRAMLTRFLPLLRPEGRLFVGHSESLSHVADLWEPCGKTVYRVKRHT